MSQILVFDACTQIKMGIPRHRNSFGVMPTLGNPYPGWVYILFVCCLNYVARVWAISRLRGEFGCWTGLGMSHLVSDCHFIKKIRSWDAKILRGQSEDSHHFH